MHNKQSSPEQANQMLNQSQDVQPDAHRLSEENVIDQLIEKDLSTIHN
jgi:hypothetical protein